jgi:hypothetical protein
MALAYRGNVKSGELLQLGTRQENVVVVECGYSVLISKNNGIN